MSVDDARQALRSAADYADRQLGYGKPRFYIGIFGLIAVSIAFGAFAVYAIVVGDLGTAILAGVGSVLMFGAVIWRVRTWSRKAPE